MIRELLILKLSRLLPLKELRSVASSEHRISKKYNLLKKNVSESVKEEAELILKECEALNINVVPFYNDAYSKKLKTISNPPVLLFAKGDINLLNKPSFSIVGTRDADIKACEWTKEFVSNSPSNKVIVSGGAIGIDISAHKAALESNKSTICVLGSGINNIYPLINKPIIEEIFDKGLVISEVPPNERVDRYKLLDRNRITSGLSDSILIVASREKGGTMKQCDVAVSQKRKIVCPNPKLNLTPQEGILKILDKGIATVIDEANDQKSQENTYQSELLMYN